jgi:hypothetical protein
MECSFGVAARSRPSRYSLHQCKRVPRNTQICMSLEVTHLSILHWFLWIHIVTCLRLLTTSERQMWRARVLETPFGLLIRFIMTSLVVTTITFYNVRSSLPCWPLSWLVLWLLASWLLLWSSDVASLSGSFDLLWSGPLISFDLLLTLRLWSVPLICFWRCVSDRLLWSASVLFFTALK